MSLIYLASPYSHASPAVEHDRFIQACAIAAHLLQQGYNVFCPIAHGHAIAQNSNIATDWQTWERG